MTVHELIRALDEAGDYGHKQVTFETRDGEVHPIEHVSYSFNHNVIILETAEGATT